MRKSLFFVFALLLPVAVHARELQWPAFVVDARLDSEGRLHVIERQTMLFTGDWNGGERIFNIRFGQAFRFREMYRIAPTDEKIQMRSGGTDKVDDYDFVEQYTLRWRSRMPDDPPFERTPLTYELHYTLDKVLLPREGNTYVLDHDFAFPAREGPILDFRLNLQIDPVWKTERSFEMSHAAGFLEPGRGYVLTVPLTYSGEGVPAGVRVGAPRPFRLGALAVLVAGFLAIAIAFLLTEHRKGRFARVGETVDEAWLDSHVFIAEPEVIGALWDRSTGASEVAAILAKLTQEKKITAEVSKPGFFRQPEMELTWHGDRSGLRPYERALVDALFFDGSHTSTAKIRSHYKSSGFDPVSKISKPLDAFIERHPQWKGRKTKPVWIPALVVVLIATAILGGTALLGGYDMSGALTLGFAGIFVTVFGSVIAHSVRHALTRVPLKMLGYSVPTLIHAAIATVFLLRDELLVGPFSVFAFVFFVLACYAFVTTFARIPPTADKLASRHRLALARDYFKRQLRSASPDLKDEWMPWLIAFGLGPQVDAWVKRFGVAAAAAGIGGSTMRTASSFGSSSSSTPSGSSSAFSGGGGAFGGAGATGSWAVAAGAIASGVAAPSSGGSGGGGGGGGSSGGGGGGGW